MYNNGEIIPACGTPERSDIFSDRVSPIFTLWERFDKNDLCYLCKIGVIFTEV